MPSLNGEPHAKRTFQSIVLSDENQVSLRCTQHTVLVQYAQFACDPKLPKVTHFPPYFPHNPRDVESLKRPRSFTYGWHGAHLRKFLASTTQSQSSTVLTQEDNSEGPGERSTQPACPSIGHTLILSGMCMVEAESKAPGSLRLRAEHRTATRETWDKGQPQSVHLSYAELRRTL